MTEMDRIKIYYLGALIASILGGIILLAFNFIGFEDWYESRGAINAFMLTKGPKIYGPQIIIMAVVLFICSIVSILGLKSPDLLREKILKTCIGLSVFVLIWTIFLAILGLMDLNDNFHGASFPENAWFEAGFYGSLFGGLITTICLFFAYRECEHK